MAAPYPAKKIADVKHKKDVRAAALGARSGQMLVTGGEEATVSVWHIASHDKPLRVRCVLCFARLPLAGMIAPPTLTTTNLQCRRLRRVRR